MKLAGKKWSTAMLPGVMLTASVAAMPLAPADMAHPAPAFTHAEAQAWINSPPLRWEQLRGQVVLLDFWTFACWNCYRSFPWLNALYSRYQSQGLKVIGVHTPELPHERDRATLLKKIRQYELQHPIMVDDDHSYWNALNNRYWPAFYLLCMTRGKHDDGHAKNSDSRADEIPRRGPHGLNQPKPKGCDGDINAAVSSIDAAR